MVDLTDEELLAELGVSVEPPKARSYSQREERIIAGFEDIQKFVDEHGRPPLHGEDRDIFERLYAVRLDRLRAQPDCRDLLAGMDRQGLLDAATETSGGFAEEGDDNALLAELGATPLTHVLTAGGGAQNTIWTGIRRRLLGVPVLTATHHAAAYGAACLARQGPDLLR